MSQRTASLRHFTLPTVLCALATSMLPNIARAQEVDDLSVQRFDPAPGPDNFLVTRSAAVSGHLTWTAGLLANYAYEPFTVNSVEQGVTTPIKVVENLVTADVLGSLTLIDRLQIGLKIPVAWSEGHGLAFDADGRAQRAEGELSAVGMGDVQLEVKGRFYGEPGEMIVLGAYLYGTAPTGMLTAEGSFIGNSPPAAGGALIADGKVGPFLYGVNLGGLYRGAADIGETTTLGPEARFSVAGGYDVSPILDVVLDVHGSSNFDFGGLGTSNVELDGAVKFTPLGNQFTLIAGAGAGLFKGVGTPTVRAIVGMSYNAASTDRDGDGIADDVDACPDAAEDMDGFEDGDGCPEFDNDQDGLPDDADKCPNEAEDFDGFEDKDGCPDLDNDGDGIKDVADHCPMEPETMNGIDDLDGCPDEADRDQDGVPDDQDQCPDEPEDTDGFQDTDGCPDPDNDQDGIPDNEDACFELKEDGKGTGYEPTDGCPIDA